MTDTLDPFIFDIEAAFDAAEEAFEVVDEPATTLREYLASAAS